MCEHAERLRERSRSRRSALPPFEDSTPKLPLSQTSVEQVLARRFVQRLIATDVSEINGKGIVEGIEVIGFLTAEARYASVGILFQPRDESQFLIRPRVSLNFVQRVVIERARWTRHIEGNAEQTRTSTVVIWCLRYRRASLG
jgi:hypothetical protein